MNNYIVEVCAGSVQSCIEAEKGGAKRVELCDNLFEGGTTPSAAVIEAACKLVKIPIYVMIRPRGGDFFYSDLEFDLMLRDIEFAKQFGAVGIALGLLTPNGQIDEVRTAILVHKAKSLGMGATFHRAFDMTTDANEALEAVIRTGCERILTSGGKNKATEGKDQIAQMVKNASGRIKIMAGSGVNPSNALELVSFTGISDIHMSGKQRVAGGMIYKKPNINMGGIPGIPEYEIDITDADAVRKVVDALK